MDKEFIHLFRTFQGYFLYDVNTDCIIKISPEIYHNMEMGSISENVTNYKNFLKQQGFLKTSRVEVIEHPVTEFLPYFLQTKIANMILQVTQNCNLRCEYCVYSGKYNNREHTNKRMSFHTAKRAIDFLLEHSKERDKIYIGFYGGEPLLEFELIKKCIIYAREVFEGKEVCFNFTTNATLLTEDKIEDIVKNDVRIMVSIDGPRHVHDKHRKFANNHAGSFDMAIKNLNYIKHKYPDYYKKCVTFNIVLDINNDLEDVLQFFHENELFEAGMCNVSFISDRNLKENSKEYNEKFAAQMQYSLFKLYLQMIGKLKSTSASIFYSQIVKMREIRDTSFAKRASLPQKGHRGGPCVPGVFRLFVTVDGRFFPCERVSESSCVCEIGDIENGYNIENIKKIVNIGKYTEEQCKNCWAYSYCTICIGDADGYEKISKEKILQNCEKVRKLTEETFLNYITLREIGYDFVTEDFNFPQYRNNMEKE